MKVASAVRVGMPADEVLKMRGRSSEFAIAAPTEVDKDEEGYVVAWHYFDCDASLILEDNEAIIKVIDVFGGKYYKRWRIYDLHLK